MRPTPMTTTNRLRRGWLRTFGLPMLLLLTIRLPALGADSSLEARLMPLIEAHRGKVAVAVKNLATGETFVYHADDPMPTASLIKFPVMVETYRQAAEKTIDLHGMVTLRDADKVQDSGILTS